MRSVEEMFPLIQEWGRSSLSQKEFYTHHRIKPHVFYYWLRRYREEEEPASKGAGGFVSVEMAEEEPSEAVLAEVIYSDGTRLVLKERVSAAFLQGILPKV
jgi:transposase-like protein